MPIRTTPSSCSIIQTRSEATALVSECARAGIGDEGLELETGKGWMALLTADVDGDTGRQGGCRGERPVANSFTHG